MSIPEQELEIRIAPVMTGGVSLSVWMGGVTCELYRAIFRDGSYKDLLEGLGERVIVDVITGTSAGGLNGVLLGAALALRLSVADFKSLRDVWLDDGSIGDLLRSPFEPDPPSLLRGDEHFLKRIRLHLDSWYGTVAGDEALSPRPPESLEARSELVLLVTATTLTGEPERFVDDFGQPINQSTHEALFTFRGTDLIAADAAARLSLAARTSASFPGAFEPSYCPVDEVGPGGQPDVSGIASFSRSRYAVDGGVLRNLPLGPAIDAIFRQPAQSETRRLLAYVNPDPPAPVNQPPDSAETPDLGPVVGASLIGLPRHESVASHLREIKTHNRRVAQQRASRRNILRAIDDMDAAAVRVYEEFKRRRIDDSVRATSAQVVRRALRLGVPESRALDAEAELKKCAGDPQLWFPTSFPATGFLPANEPEQAPWPWGIAPLEYAASTLGDLLRRAVVASAAGSGGPPRSILSCRRDISQAVKALGALRAVDDAYWALRTALLTENTTVEAVWADASYRWWPSVDDEAAKAVATNHPQLVERYHERVRTALTELHEAGVTVSSLEQAPTRAALCDLAMKFASSAWDARSDLHSLSASDGEAKVVVDAILQGVDEDGHQESIVRRLLALFVVQVAVAGAESPGEQTVELLQVSAHVCHGIDRQRQRASAVGKLTGVGMHHFAAFFKRSWRANDWMWGRLDGADRLALALVDPKRLKALRPEPSAACELVKGIAVGDGADAEALEQRFDAAGVEDEISAAFASDDVRSLPKAAAAVALRLQVGILREELPAVAEAVRRSEQAGGALGEQAAAFVRAADAAAMVGPADTWAPSVLEELLSLCRIGEETVAAELGSDAMTLAAAQAAAVTTSALRGKKSGLGPVRNLLRSVRMTVVLLYALIRAAVTGGPAGAMVIAGGLTASATVVGLSVSGADIKGAWVAFSVVLLVVWCGLVIVTSGSLLAAVPLAAGLALVVAFNGDRLADAMQAPAEGWREVVIDNHATTGRVVAGVFAVALLVTIASFWSSVASRGWRRGALVRGVAALTFLAFALWAKARLPSELEAWLADPRPSPSKMSVINWLERAHSFRFAIVAAALPALALLLEAARRLPRGIRRAAWLVRSTRLTPALVADTTRPTGQTDRACLSRGSALIYVAIGTSAVAGIAMLPGTSDDDVRLVLGLFAAAFVLLPGKTIPGTAQSRHGWLVAGLDKTRDAAAAATRIGGRFGAALCIPIAVAWASGLFGVAPEDDTDLGGVLYHALVIVVGVACLEEFLFRGVALRVLSFNGNAATGVVLSSIAFAFSHVLVSNDLVTSGSSLWLALGVGGVLAFTAVAGLMFGWLHLRTRSLIAPVLVHAGVNLSVYLAVVTS